MTITIQRPSTRILTPGARGIRYAQPGKGDCLMATITAVKAGNWSDPTVRDSDALTSEVLRRKRPKISGGR